ncbi:hypothetical protein ABZ281_28120 [Streptomyces sp. NPDC006265]|uniref:hypothetical protein n=1 Tax=Streptomyces sp. NPDC006265 TaxID=3156740 RepID=UPI0033B46BD9
MSHTGESVADVFDGSSMYPDVDSVPGEERDFTVTIAGAERHDGEAPYTYVVRAASQSVAWSMALSTHIHREDTVDCYIVPSQSFEGVPAEDCGYHWNDLRLQNKFWEKVQEIVELIKAYDESDKDNRDADGYVLDEKQATHDDLVGDYEMDAFPMAEDLAHYATHI